MCSNTASQTQNEEVDNQLHQAKYGESLRQFYLGDVDRESLELDEWTNPIVEADGELALVFDTAHGGHFVTSSGSDLIAIYAGPHGPENQPAQIDEATIGQLVNESSDISIRPVEETPFTNTVIFAIV